MVLLTPLSDPPYKVNTRIKLFLNIRGAYRYIHTSEVEPGNNTMAIL